MTASVLVTRPGVAGRDLAADLAAVGIRAHVAPMIETRPVAPGGKLDHCLERLDTYDWVVITSPNAVAAVFDRLRALGREVPADLRWAAAGAVTAAALAERGVIARVTPATAGARHVAAELVALGVGGAAILCPQADLAEGDLEVLLAASGALVTAVDAYQTLVGPATSRANLELALDDPELGVITFASGSAVLGLLAMAGERLARAEMIPVAVIGPRTADAAHEAGFRVAAIATSARPGELVAAVQRVLAGTTAA